MINILLHQKFITTTTILDIKLALLYSLPSNNQLIIVFKYDFVL
jgi:hypothetical protein